MTERIDAAEFRKRYEKPKPNGIEYSQPSSIEIEIDPVPKPRMTQRDHWYKRPATDRYYAFCNRVRQIVGAYAFPPQGGHITFHLPMPPSWSRRRRDEMRGAPHTQRPDVDNLCKALLDALNVDDAHIWDVRMTKRWADTGKIEIRTTAQSPIEHET